MFKHGLMLALLACFSDLLVRGQTNQSSIPVAVTIPDTETKTGGIVEVKCTFPLEKSRFSALWWRVTTRDVNEDIVFFQDKEGPGSKLGNYGDLILDSGHTLAETPGGMSEHHIIVDTTLCQDGWKFGCQVISNDEHEGKGEAVLKFKDPEVRLDICEKNCENMMPNTTHSISCVAIATRNKPSVTITVSDDVITGLPMNTTEKVKNSCNYATVKRADLALDTNEYYKVTCIVKDGDKNYGVSRDIGVPRGVANAVSLHTGLIAFFLVRCFAKFL